VRALPDAILAVDWGQLPDDRRRALRLMNAIATECHTVRAIGSSAALAPAALGYVLSVGKKSTE